MAWKIFKWIVLIALVLVIGYIGLSCWSSSSCAKPTGDQSNMPDIEDATHEFYIKNTGGLVLSSDYEQHGDTAGSRLFILHGFWEMRGNKFKYVTGDIILNEGVFGEITVKRRSK